MEELFHIGFVVHPSVYMKGVVWHSGSFPTDTGFLMVANFLGQLSKISSTTMLIILS